MNITTIAIQLCISKSKKPVFIYLTILIRFELDRKTSIYLKSVEESWHNTRQNEVMHAPRKAGSEADYVHAVEIATELTKYGIHAEIIEYYTLLSNPVQIQIHMIHARKNEQTVLVAEDYTTPEAIGSCQDTLAFMAYSASGNITAPVLYLHEGLPEDFTAYPHSNLGTFFHGKIALVKSTHANNPGDIAMRAEKLGFAGLLFFSNDTATTHHGSCLNQAIYSGDPLTPGVPARFNATRIENPTNIPQQILVYQLSQHQANEILKKLSGEMVPTSWNTSVKSGNDGLVQLHMNLIIDNTVGPIWNVIGTIKGEIEPNQTVVLGSRRDSWTCPTQELNKGLTREHSSLLQVARGFATLLRSGWRPRRTIVLASWDGELDGSLGSTEWMEDNANMLRAEAVSYLALDDISSLPSKIFDGHVQVDVTGSPSLANIIGQTSKQMQLRGQNITFNVSGDQSVFNSHFGIPSLHIAIKQAENAIAIDSENAETIVSKLVQLWGLLGLRLADDNELPPVNY